MRALVSFHERAMLIGETTSIHVKISEQLWKSLNAFAQLEKRTISDASRYLIEVMLLVANRQPSFELTPAPYAETSDHDIRVYLSKEMEAFLKEMAERYRLRLAPYVRASLWTALELKKTLAPRSKLMPTEVFVRLITERHKAMRSRIS